MTLRTFGDCASCGRNDIDPDEAYCASCSLHASDERSCGFCGEDIGSWGGSCGLCWHEGQDWSRAA